MRAATFDVTPELLAQLMDLPVENAIVGCEFVSGKVRFAVTNTGHDGEHLDPVVHATAVRWEWVPA